MNKTSWVLLIIIIVFGYHAAVLAPVQYRMWDDDSMKINPFTNTIIMELNIQGPWERLGAELAVPISERMFNNMARRYFDIYALILPYRVIIR